MFRVEFGPVLHLVKIEVVMHAVEVVASGSVRSVSRVVDRVLYPGQNGLLGEVRSLLRSVEGVVVVTIAVYIIGVNLVDVLFEFYCEVTTARRFFVKLTSSVPILPDFGIDEGTIDHVLYLIVRKSKEIHNSVANHHPFQIDRRLRVKVVLIDQHSEVRNVLASIGLACQPKRVALIFRVELEEVKQSIHVVYGRSHIAVVEGLIVVVRIAHPCRRFDK
jgi:hypothetical protein